MRSDCGQNDGRIDQSSKEFRGVETEYLSS